MRLETPYTLTDAERDDVGEQFTLVKFAMSRFTVVRHMMKVAGRDETLSFLAEMLCKARHKYRADRGMKFSSFALYYLRRQTLNWLRDRRKRVTRPVFEMLPHDATADARRDGFEELTELLPDADARELLQLRYVEELSTKELATRYGTTPAAIVERLIKLRKTLKHHLHCIA